MNTVPNYIFRQAELSDLKFYFDSMISLEGSFIDSFDFEVNYKLKMDNKDFNLFVIEDMSVPVGCVTLQKVQNLSDSSPWMEIVEFYIIPKYRKLHAADFFYHKIEAYVSKLGVYKMKVSCKINSTITQHFYTKRGYKIQKKTYTKFIS